MTTDDDGRPPHRPDSLTDAPILDQAFDAGSLYALRAAVAAHATSAGLAPGRADDLVIAVHELAANAVRHGAGHGRLRVWRSEHALLCEITDDGLPDGAREAQTTPEWRAEPGHGLSLVRQVADQTTLRSGRDGTSATISFVLAPPGGPPFALARQQHEHCTVLTVTGSLDLTSTAQLTQAVQEELRSQKARLILDLHRLTGWDAAGLAALITAQQQVSAAPDARLVLAALPAQLEEHLRDAGTSDRFTLAADQAQAQRKLSEP
jgi:anti-anti-sigma factor